MSVTCGFYNALNHDRRYDAIQMSSIFDGIIRDGIFETIGTAMMVTPHEGMIIHVGIGRAWFNHTWTLNDSILPLTVTQAEVILDRIDTVVLEINAEEDTRNNTIKIVNGTPSSNPSAPELIDTELVHQYPLADIYVASGVESISASNITNRVGTSDTPFVIGVLEVMDVDNLVAQWQTQFEELIEADGADFDQWKETTKAAFDVWFENLRDELDENQAAHLQAQIGALPSLETTDKTDLVSAINELLASAYPMIQSITALRLNTAAGKVVDSLVIKEMDNKTTFPDGNGFYPDIQNGKRGFNTDPKRGADTFVPFKSAINSYKLLKTISCPSKSPTSSPWEVSWTTEIIDGNNDYEGVLIIAKGTGYWVGNRIYVRNNASKGQTLDFVTAQNVSGDGHYNNATITAYCYVPSIPKNTSLTVILGWANEWLTAMGLTVYIYVADDN